MRLVYKGKIIDDFYITSSSWPTVRLNNNDLYKYYDSVVISICQYYCSKSVDTCMSSDVYGVDIEKGIEVICCPLLKIPLI